MASVEVFDYKLSLCSREADFSGNYDFEELRKCMSQLEFLAQRVALYYCFLATWKTG